MRLLKRVGDDKGGSLVELIIVIAIMAVLVAILAPQFIKYLGRARETALIEECRKCVVSGNTSTLYTCDISTGVLTP